MIKDSTIVITKKLQVEKILKKTDRHRATVFTKVRQGGGRVGGVGTALVQ